MNIRLLFIAVFLISLVTLSVHADDYCKGYHSPSNPFQCFKHGNCVWWAAYKRPDLKAHMHGNAREWYRDAINVGFPVGRVPVKGSIVVFNGLKDDKGKRYGHVAYVESVNEDGSFNVSQMDYYGKFGDGVSTGRFSMQATYTVPHTVGQTITFRTAIDAQT